MSESKADKPNQRVKLPTVEQISAGGVAYREIKGKLEVAIVSVNPTLRWQIPKGIIDKGETPEVAAVREVREEAGIETELIMPIDTVEYWYVGNLHSSGERVRFHKFVHFYLLKYHSGEVENHDHEVAEARWVSVKDAVKMLSFTSEKAVIKKAAELMGI